VNPVRQLTGADEGSREHDVAREEAVGVKCAEYTQQDLHGATNRRRRLLPTRAS
jgi:hypothetical protein